MYRVRVNLVLLPLVQTCQPQLSARDVNLLQVLVKRQYNMDPYNKVMPTLLFQEFGGLMTLTDVYCRMNRARGMEVSLVSSTSEYIVLTDVTMDAS